MKIYLCSPTYRRFDLWVRMVRSALAGTRQPDMIAVLDNSGTTALTAYLKENAPDIYELENLHILNAPRNLGVAGGWNALLEHVKHQDPEAWALVVNDDIEFLPDTIQRFSEAPVYDLMLVGDGVHAVNAFSMFFVKPIELLSKVGPFDSTIWPAYYDDNDMHYRMKLLGYGLQPVENCGAVHNEGGSATIKSYTPEERLKHDMQFTRNGEYYMMKWGNLPGNETYITPFNGGDVMEMMKYLYSKYGF